MEILMCIVSLFSGSYCHGEEVAQKLAQTLGYELLDDHSIIEMTSQRFRIAAKVLGKALSGKTSAFNPFTHEREKSLACLRVVVAELLHNDRLILHGALGNVMRPPVPHIVKVCVTTDIGSRASEAMVQEGYCEDDAFRKLHEDDARCLRWTEFLFHEVDPWSPRLYDLVLPMDRTTVDEGVATTLKMLQSNEQIGRSTRLKRLDEFSLAAEVNLRLTEEGHHVKVSASGTQVTITIDHRKLVLFPAEEELRRLALSVPSVTGVNVEFESGCYITDVYREPGTHRIHPSKVLLVGDDQGSVSILCERLIIRGVGCVPILDSKAALQVIEEEEPQIILLHTKPEDQDYLELLKHAKKEYPELPVIVCAEREVSSLKRTCLALGTDKYIEMPLDIDRLIRIIQNCNGPQFSGHI